MRVADDDVHGTTKYDPATHTITVDRRYDSGKPNKVTRYVVTFLCPNPGIGAPAVRLMEESGSSYDIIRMAGGWWECECPDYHNRRAGKVDANGNPLLCKHLKAALKTVLKGA